MAKRNRILEAVAELPDPGEAVPTRWPEQPGTGSRQFNQYYGGPERDRRHHRRSGGLRTQSCECPEKQTIFHFTSSACHHLTTLPHAHNDSICDPSLCNFLQTRVACYLRYASCQLGNRLSIVPAANRAGSSRIRAEMLWEDRTALCRVNTNAQLVAHLPDAGSEGVSEQGSSPPRPHRRRMTDVRCTSVSIQGH